MGPNILDGEALRERSTVSVSQSSDVLIVAIEADGIMMVTVAFLVLFGSCSIKSDPDIWI